MPVIRPDGRMYYPCLEWKQAEINLLEAGSYREALRAAQARFGALPDCRDCCHIFCHMALSLAPTHPLSALGELKHWRALNHPWRMRRHEPATGTPLPVPLPAAGRGLSDRPVHPLQSPGHLPLQFQVPDLRFLEDTSTIRPTSFSLDDIRLIGRKLNRLGTLIISLAGGEPLIREDIYDIITALNAANHFPILITNGWFVDETVARDILRAGLQEISVSVDYRDPARHDAQRGCPGAWERAIRALELFHKNRPDRRNRVHMISVLMDDNLDDVEPLIQLSPRDRRHLHGQSVFLEPRHEEPAPARNLGHASTCWI